jgi:hypothetical protein
MVACNLCLENKPIEEIQHPFRYVCKECWNKLRIIPKERIDGLSDIDKGLIY